MTAAAGDGPAIEPGLSPAEAPPPVEAPVEGSPDAGTPSHAGVQARTVRTLSASQVLGGIGVGSGVAVGGLLAEDVSGSASVAGLAQTAAVFGSALLAVPVSRLMAARGRRPGLAAAYLTGLAGAVVVVVGAVAGAIVLVLAGMLMFGAGTTATLLSRYAATDLATPDRRGRALSTVVWATTVGAVLGPNLAEPGAALAEALDLPRLAGPFLFSLAAYALAVAVLLLLLRPDPLLLARTASHVPATLPAGAPEPGPSSVGTPAGTGLAASLRTVAAYPGALLGLTAMAVAHTVMVAVMVMTPVHMGHGDVGLRVVGLVISVHVAGMFALSPVVGWLADAIGRHRVILLGAGLLVLATAIAGPAGSAESVQLGVGLFLLGLGWSCALVAGSTLLTESVPVPSRPGVQGAADLVMGVAAGSAGALSGLVVGAFGYGVLNVAAAILAVPLLWRAAAYRPARVVVG